MQEVNDHQAQVREFHEVMALSIRDTPGPITKELAAFRIDLIEEELRELKGVIVYDEYATLDDALVRAADAIADILYVTYGAACALGINIHPVFNAVHRANMRKRDGPLRGDGKRLKPPGWVGPEAEIRQIIRHQQGLVEQYDGAEFEGAR